MNTPLRDELDKCVTWADSEECLSKQKPDDLSEYISALEAVKQYIHITMRDQFLLEQAKRIHSNLVGNFQDPVQQ